MFILPSRETKTLRQLNDGNILGELWSTFGIDLSDNNGTIRLSKKVKLNTTSDNEANLGLPIAFANFDLRMFCIAGTKIFKNTGNNITSSFVEDASTGVPTGLSVAESDMNLFNGELVVAKSNRIYTKAANGSGTGAWTDRGALSSGYHKLTYFNKFDREYIVDNNVTIKSADTSWSVATSGDNFIDIGDTKGYISTIVASSDYIWIGTYHPSNLASGVVDSSASASILLWDGLSSTITKEFKINAKGILSMVVKDDTVYAMDSNGNLLKYNGYSFSKIGQLPVNYEILNNATTVLSSDSRFIHPNGLEISRNGTILALINNQVSDNTGSILENLQSGIWEWNESNGFIHRYPISFLARTSSTITDYGQNRVSAVGAIKVADIMSTSSLGKSTIVCGLNYYKTVSSTASGIFIDTPVPSNDSIPEGQKAGYFITSWLLSSQLKDSWIKVITKHRKLLNSSDKIVLKYRIYEEEPTEVTSTWVNTTTFKTTTDVSDYSVGDEIEIISGIGAGKCTHIASIQSGDTEYIITIEDAVSGATTTTSKMRFQKWKKFATIQNQIAESSKNNIGISSERIQLKIYMEWTGDNEIFELIILNKLHESLD